MTAKIDIYSSDGIVRTTIRGGLTIDDGCDALRRTAEQGADGHYRHLLDLRQARVVGVLAWSCRRARNARLPRARRLCSIALLCASGERRAYALAEAIAKAGFRSRSFTDEIDALTWLHATSLPRRRRRQRSAKAL